MQKQNGWLASKADWAAILKLNTPSEWPFSDPSRALHGTSCLTGDTD